MWSLMEDATIGAAADPPPHPAHGVGALRDPDPSRLLVGLCPRQRLELEVGGHAGTLCLQQALADALSWTVRGAGGAVVDSGGLALLCATGPHALFYGPWVQARTVWVDLPWQREAFTVELELRNRHDRRGPAEAWSGGAAGRFLDAGGAPVALNLRRPNAHQIGLGSTVRLEGWDAPLAAWGLDGLGRPLALLGSAAPWSAGDRVMLFGGPEGQDLLPATVAGLDGGLVATLEGAEGWGVEQGPSFGNLARVWTVTGIDGNGSAPGAVELDGAAPAGGLVSVIPSPRLGLAWVGRADREDWPAEEGAAYRDGRWDLTFAMNAPEAERLKGRLDRLRRDDANQPWAGAFFNLFPGVSEHPRSVIWGRPVEGYSGSVAGRGADQDTINLTLEEVR